MKRIETVNKLDREFGLMNLFRMGIIQWIELRDRDIYLQYDIYIRQGKLSMDAREQTAEDFGVEITTVHRAIRKMNNEETSNTPTRTEGEA
jgi:hypothetical protein